MDLKSAIETYIIGIKKVQKKHEQKMMSLMDEHKAILAAAQHRVEDLQMEQTQIFNSNVSTTTGGLTVGQVGPFQISKDFYDITWPSQQTVPNNGVGIYEPQSGSLRQAPTEQEVEQLKARLAEIERKLLMAQMADMRASSPQPQQEAEDEDRELFRDGRKFRDEL